MFNLFNRKKQGATIIDKIWMHETAKLQSFVTEWKKNPSLLYLFWFEETMERVTVLFEQEQLPVTDLALVRTIPVSSLQNKTIVFAEHYPLREKEKETYDRLQLAGATIWSALDEPLFHQFGGEKIIAMMKQLGMKEDSSIEHAMITKAIQKAQDKIAAKVSLEQSARSQTEWMKRNLEL